MDNTTKIMMSISLYGEDFDIDSINEKLNISPTRYKKKGDRIRNSEKHHESYAWTYETEYYNTLFLDEVSIHFLEIFAPKLDTIKELMRRYNLEVRIHIVPIMEGDITPALFLEKELIQFASHLNSSIDIDLYVNKTS